MQQTLPLSIFWLRRDLRLEDNAGLYHALKEGAPVLPLFIFDTNILSRLEDKTDKRLLFIYRQLQYLSHELKKYGSSLLIKTGSPVDVWKQLISQYTIKSVFTNRDYEPYAISRDNSVQDLLKHHHIPFFTYKDHVIFEKYEVLKEDGRPYTVFTPYSKKWLAKLAPYYHPYPVLKYARNFFKTGPLPVPSLNSLGFIETDFQFPEKIIPVGAIKNYDKTRNYPAAVGGTSKLGIHLRFGTLSIRQLLGFALAKNATYVNELIWREFYQMILAHFPHVAQQSFKPAYDNILWENDEEKFAAWCRGSTGYPLVDAGMRELNATGYMHNRVRMVTASFLTKHLLIDWHWGETYFAGKLLDFELASNNGGWQWASGSGTDAAPYFRIFNPQLQMEKFDPQLKYVKRWVPEYGTDAYAKPVVIHAIQREKALRTYKTALNR